MLLLCHRLEAVADGLPDDFDRGNCSLLALTLSPRLAAAQAFEETAMFPLLLAWSALSDEMQLVLGQLHGDHQMDLFQA